MSCERYSADYPFKINPRPPDDLDLNCLCLSVYLEGSPDITGPGVIASFIVQIVLAALVWGYQFTNYIIMPLVNRGDCHAGVRQFFLVEDYHEACVWHQLVFSFALCVAGLVRQTQNQQPFIGIYESVSIVSSVAVTVSATVLATISFLPGYALPGHPDHSDESPRPRFGRRRFVFLVAYMGTLITGLFAVLSPFLVGRVDNLLRICQDHRTHENREWGHGSLLPVGDDKAEYLGLTVAATLAVVGGLVSWQCIRHDRTRRSVLVVWTVSSVFLWYIVGDYFRGLLAMRGQMEILWGAAAEQDVWTIGQIGALCSWAPLLADVIFVAAIPRFWNRVIRG